MNSDMRPLPKVKAVPGETIARFRAVGVDSHGHTLYQKVETNLANDFNKQVDTRERFFETELSASLGRLAIKGNNLALAGDGQTNMNYYASMQDQNQNTDLPDESNQDLASNKDEQIHTYKIPKDFRTSLTTLKNKDEWFHEIDEVVSHYGHLSPEDVRFRHDESVRNYPDVCDLSEREFVIMEVKRFSLFKKLIWAAWLAVLIFITSAWLVFSSIEFGPGILQIREQNLSKYVGIIVGLVDLILLAVAYISAKVYVGNRMIITSERVIQFMTNGLFDSKIQTIDLNGVEDVSFHQQGILAHLLNYGLLRLSTVGDETSYTLSYVPFPAETADKIGDIVQAAKNNRSTHRPTK